MAIHGWPTLRINKNMHNFLRGESANFSLTISNTYLGFHASKDGVLVVPLNIKAMKNWP